MPKVLIVDDDASFIFMLESRFTEAGYIVETAGNGSQALEKLELFDFDVLISDVMMPDMDGMELVKKLRSSTETRDLPVIFLTGSSYYEIDVAWRKLELKYAYLLSKTCGLDELLEKVEAILRADTGRGPVMRGHE